MPKFVDVVYVGGVKVNTSTEEAALLNVAPAVTGVALDGTKKIITVTFAKPVFQNTLTTALLKAAVTFSAGGVTFVALGASDTVAVTFPRVVTITFDSAISGATNKFKIAADALCSGNGTGNALYTSAAVDAS